MLFHTVKGEPLEEEVAEQQVEIIIIEPINDRFLLSNQLMYLYICL